MYQFKLRTYKYKFTSSGGSTVGVAGRGFGFSIFSKYRKGFSGDICCFEFSISLEISSSSCCRLCFRFTKPSKIEIMNNVLLGSNALLVLISSISIFLQNS